jgi:hypothetical protein
MFKKNKTTFLLLMLFFSIFLSGCDRLRTIDEYLGVFFDEEKKAPEAVSPEEPKEVIDATGLSRELKERIDVWLEANGFNRYGDPEGTYYMGGTPLFDERTGETRERYEYIMEKQPDILNKL